MPLATGARLGPYEVVSALGAGGMGEVYKARDTRLDRSVAIKVLAPEIAGGVSANSRLRAELQEHGRLREMPTFLPSLQLSTDNAAMIAAAGLRKFRAGFIAPADLNADPSLAL